MKRVFFIFAWLYAAGFALAGLLILCFYIMDDTRELAQLSFGLVLEIGFLAAPAIFLIACLIAGLSRLFSKAPSEEFSVSPRTKCFFQVVAILFFLVLPFFIFRDTMFRGAARRGNIGRARLWLALGADINSRQREGNTALAEAISYGHRDMVAYLLRKNIAFQTNAILASVPNGHEDIADILRQHGAAEIGVRSRNDAVRCKRTPEQHRYANFTSR